MKNCKCNKLNPNCPPDISGEFNLNGKAYGNQNGRVFPIDKPFEYSVMYTTKQNGIFVENTFKWTNDDRGPSPGIWRKKYDNNLNFAGWDLYIADSTNDNGYLIFTPLCVKNNKVMKFSGIYIESGFMEGNPIQNPLVLSVSGVRVCK